MIGDRAKERGREWAGRFLPPPVLGKLPERLSGLSDDSRTVGPGTLFILRCGSTYNEQHLREAVDRGAALLLVPEIHLSSVARRLGEWGCDIPVCATPHIQEASGIIASAWWDFPSRTLSIVGVTGTNGKTTSSFLTREILEAAGKRTGLIGTVWFDLGDGMVEAPQTTPGALFLQESFARGRENGLSAISMEVSSHALDQERVAGTHFSAVHFTNLTRDHLDYHKTFEDYFLAKSRLVLWTNPDGSQPGAVVNGDDPYGKRLLASLRGSGRMVLSYGHDPSFDIHPGTVRISLDGIEGTIRLPGGEMRISSSLPGDFNLQNMMGSIGCALVLGIEIPAIEAGIRTLAGVPGRFERVNPGGPFAVIVDYAHTDDALRNILSALRPLTTGRIITVFGCGGDRDRGKRPRMGKVAGLLSDLVILTSDNPRTEDPGSIMDDVEPGIRETGKTFFREADRKSAIGMAISAARPGDAVLIAGKGHEPYQILGKTRTSFDDRLVAREFLAGGSRKTMS
ncbi:MAG: UDP-N-acetylmuramoyl-L-alanyl-D-glutamate--2,6-diaminopimelate ligase [Nitrospirae bacterium]|nr:UDP-N-acetylmuramoyl-L-alanyl-D-glutamate--2,6-diaminopimelate ligase [Nitrospirota bacterium]MCL5286192.1 UDP-N-acetylmuramoyl-L-alanyl-D-glutamate--2,6-diaminopimelate ligase [Nitrospirota bacterium]